MTNAKQGLMGEPRGMTRLNPTPPLKAGDKLEPYPSCPDVGKDESLAAFPCRVVFWRCSRESPCMFRCPLWSPAFGITPMRCVAVDVLHSLYLGPMPEWSSMATWKLFDGNVHGGRHECAEEYRIAAVALVKSDIFNGHGEQERRDQTVRFTRLSNITPKM
eukprot:934540-Pyramimonas_sp.AAC.1